MLSPILFVTRCVSDACFARRVGHFAHSDCLARHHLVCVPWLSHQPCSRVTDSPVTVLFAFLGSLINLAAITIERYLTVVYALVPNFALISEGG